MFCVLKVMKPNRFCVDLDLFWRNLAIPCDGMKWNGYCVIHLDSVNWDFF